ncbi:MAG: MerR family transcriptional regulator [Cocleimonas sp.]
MKNFDSIIPVSDEGLYPIRTVSEVSGVNSITLRAWERRYGLFKPKRTPKGHRLYSEKDIKLIHQVLELLAKGVSIGRVAKALKEEHTVTNLLPTGSESVSSKELTSNQWGEHQETLLNRINTYDILQLEIFHHELLSHYGTETISENLIRPTLETLSNRARQLQSLSGDYHFYRTFLLHRIGGLFLNLTIQNIGEKILLIPVDSEQDDVELLLYSMFLLKQGYQVVILGCGVSFDAIPMALSASSAEGLMLYSEANTSNQVTTNSFHTLVSSLKIPVFIKGQFSEHQEKGLQESGLLILPTACKKQIAMIDKNLNKVTK